MTMQPGRVQLSTDRYFKASQAPAQSAPHVFRLSPQSPTPPPIKPRSGWWWIRAIALFPVRLMALLILLVLIPGTVSLWRLPPLAARGDVELTLLALRVIDQDRVVAPLAPTGYKSAIRKHVIELEPEGKNYEHALGTIFSGFMYRLHATGQTCRHTPEGGYEYTITYNGCPARKVNGTTPHLNVKQEDLVAARQALTVLFPDPQQWRELLDWGECLFWTEWTHQNSFFEVPLKLVPAPLGGTEDERLWLAWQVLRGNMPGAEADLTRLDEQFHQTFPRPEDQTAALRWAQDLYARMESNFLAYQQFQQEKLEAKKKERLPEIESWEGAASDTIQVQAQFKRALPPKTQWTYQWLVYRYIGLGEPSQSVARKRWLEAFPAQARERLLEFGTEVLAQRRAAGEPLPPVAKNLPLLCAVERLIGSDPYGQHCRELIKQEYGTGLARQTLNFSVLSAYPNDEMFFLLATSDPLQMHPMSGDNVTLEARIARACGSALFTVVSGLGIITLLSWIVVPLLVRGSARTLWQKHVDGRGSEPIWLWVLSVVFFAALGTLLAPHTLPAAVHVNVGSYFDLFLGSLAATMIGGVFIASSRRILAVLLILFRVDIESTWLDEILGILLGGYILFHFGNDPFGIALFALSDLAPGLIAAALQHSHAQQKEALAPAQSVAITM